MASEPSRSTGIDRDCGNRAAFVSFVCLIVLTALLSILFFALASVDPSFVYAGIGCIGALFLFIGLFAVVRYCHKLEHSVEESSSSVQQQTTSPQPAVADERAVTYRNLSAEVDRLIIIISELRSNPGCNPDALDRQYDRVQQEYRRLIQWLEGEKTPDDNEVQQLRRSLRRVRHRLDRIRAINPHAYVYMIVFILITPNSRNRTFAREYSSMG